MRRPALIGIRDVSMANRLLAIHETKKRARDSDTNAPLFLKGVDFSAGWGWAVPYTLFLAIDRGYIPSDPLYCIR